MNRQLQIFLEQFPSRTVVRYFKEWNIGKIGFTIFNQERMIILNSDDENREVKFWGAA